MMPEFMALCVCFWSKGEIKYLYQEVFWEDDYK